MITREVCFYITQTFYKYLLYYICVFRNSILMFLHFQFIAEQIFKYFNLLLNYFLSISKEDPIKMYFME